MWAWGAQVERDKTIIDRGLCQACASRAGYARNEGDVEMQATHGLEGLFRTRGRLLGCCMALALALSALVFAPGASATEPPPTTTYLALGTSLAFGYQQEKFENHFPNEAPAYFESGYP